jgi:hypothetical protein
MVNRNDNLTIRLNEGARWEQLPDLPPQAVNSGYARFYDDGREIRALAIAVDSFLVANGYGLFRPADGGATWEVVIPYGFGPRAPLKHPPAAP